MKLFILALSVLALAWWCGSCARPQVAPPGKTPPQESQECEPEQLRFDLARGEEELVGATGERANCLIRLARLCFLLGEMSPPGEKNRYFEKGRSYAEILAKEQPAWAEGHYWAALNLCGLAEVGGAKRGLRLVTQIVEDLERALGVDPVYDQAGPHRILGRIYYECPVWPLSVGDLHKSLHHLTAAAAIAPDNSTNHLFLAETLLKLGKKTEACQELEQVLKATRHALCPKDLEEDRREALRLLKERR